MASSGKSKYKHQQSASLMLNTLNYCLKYEIDNPKLKHVSFTYVNLSGDNSILNAYVDSFDRSKINELISELDMAKEFSNKWGKTKITRNCVFVFPCTIIY